MMKEKGYTLHRDAMWTLEELEAVQEPDLYDLFGKTTVDDEEWLPIVLLLIAEQTEANGS